MAGEQSRINGRKGGKPPKPGVGDAYIPLHFPSMKAAAHALKVDINILRDARSKACNAFEASGAVHRERLIHWLKDNPPDKKTPEELMREITGEGEDDFEENYQVTDEETGGVGQTLKSLQADERRLKRRLDEIEKSNRYHATVKAELVKEARRAWLSVSKTLLQYDIKVSAARREAGELIPLSDAVMGVQALLAWHTVAMSDALRNVIPELEGKTKYQIAALIDPAMRSAIYRNFKIGVKIGKIPDWLGREAATYVAGEKQFELEPVKGITLEDI